VPLHSAAILQPSNSDRNLHEQNFNSTGGNALLQPTVPKLSIEALRINATKNGVKKTLPTTNKKQTGFKSREYIDTDSSSSDSSEEDDKSKAVVSYQPAYHPGRTFPSVTQFPGKTIPPVTHSAATNTPKILVQIPLKNILRLPVAPATVVVTDKKVAVPAPAAPTQEELNKLMGIITSKLSLSLKIPRKKPVEQKVKIELDLDETTTHGGKRKRRRSDDHQTDSPYV